MNQLRFTLVCSCGGFAHNIDMTMAARLLVMHNQHHALLYPADLYADMANDMHAEAEWCVSQ